jgi:hypothetical protein
LLCGERGGQTGGCSCCGEASCHVEARICWCAVQNANREKPHLGSE